VIDSVQNKLIDYLIYLSSGQEAIPAALSAVLSGFMIFAQHRCHGTYLAFGGNPEKLADELLGLETGTSAGRAGSNCIQCHEGGLDMFGHHGLIGENVPLGVGAALGSRKPVVCFFGDGAAEEDYVFAAMGFAVTHKLPVIFICEDNNLSILTKVEVRRSWSITEVAKSLGMPALDIADDPWTILHHAEQMKHHLPAFLNIYTCRMNWHVGIGIDGPPEWDRLSMVRNELKKIAPLAEIETIENNARREMEQLWEKKRLQKR
jgi:pyruvate dehydrogenase E1 component alpha subunit